MNDETFVFRPISKFYSLTKRGILSLVSTIFESSGILTPSGKKVIYGKKV